MTSEASHQQDADTHGLPSFWLVPLLTSATILVMLNGFLLGPFLPSISSDLEVSIAMLGQIPALSMLLSALLGLAAGPLADRFGHRRALIGGLLVAVVSALWMGLAPGYIVLLLAALVGAGSRAVTQPVAFVIAGKSFYGERQRRAIGWVSAGIGGAVIVGVPLFSNFAEYFGWRFAFALLASLTALLMLPALRIIAPDRPERSEELSFRSMLGAYRPLVQHRPTLGLIGVSLVGGTSVWLLITYMGAFYSDRFGFSVQQIGWVYLVPGLTLLTGSLAVGGKLGALPLRPFVAVTRLACGICIAILFVFSLPVSTGLVLLLIQGFTHGAAMAAVAVLLTRESPAGRATTMTLNVAAFSLSAAIGSALGGLLLAVGGFWLLGVASLLFGCFSALLAVAVRESPAEASPAKIPSLTS